LVIPREPSVSEATRDQREAIGLGAPPGCRRIHAKCEHFYSDQKYLNFSGKPPEAKILSEIREQKAVGRAAVPAIAPVVEATCRSLDPWRTRRPAPLLSNFKKYEIVPAPHYIRKQ